MLLWHTVAARIRPDANGKVNHAIFRIVEGDLKGVRK
jgi:hypothetical protein